MRAVAARQKRIVLRLAHCGVRTNHLTKWGERSIMLSRRETAPCRSGGTGRRATFRA